MLDILVLVHSYFASGTEYIYIYILHKLLEFSFFAEKCAVTLVFLPCSFEYSLLCLYSWYCNHNMITVVFFPPFFLYLLVFINYSCNLYIKSLVYKIYFKSKLIDEGKDVGNKNNISDVLFMSHRAIHGRKYARRLF